jgi:iron complex transport system permease protein
MKRQRNATAILSLALFASVVLYVCLGTRNVSPLDLLTGSVPDDLKLVVFGFRLKRALMAVVVGAALAVSGAAFQALLRNPLADPFVVGVSGGAAIGGTIVMVTFAALAAVLPLFLQSMAVFTGAFVGAVAVALMLYSLSSARGVLVTHNLLLMGVVFNFFASAVVLFLKTVLHGTKLQEVLFWLMGTLAVETLPYGVLLVTGAVVIAGTAGLIALGRDVNLVSIGEEYSHGTGVSPERVKKVLFVLASLLVAGAVSIAGFIGFVGLIVPHVVRLLAGADHRWLFPLSALSGACFLLLADLLSRLSFGIFSTQLPVGVLTAFIGGPTFIWLLARAQRRGQ